MDTLIHNNITALTLSIPAVTPAHSLNEVAELFLAPDYKHFLSLPVVRDNKPVGTISRYQLMDIYLKIYGRDVYGKQPIEKTMNSNPLIMDIAQSIEEASDYITSHVTLPITEDFIVTENGQYKGVGTVISLLNAMKQRVLQRTKELTKAYKALKSSQAQLVQSEKMASLGQMVAGVAHEINTPLGYVRNNIETIQNFFEQSQTLLTAYQNLVTAMTAAEPNLEEIATQTQTVDEFGEIFQNTELIEEMQHIFPDSLYGLDQISELVSNLKDFSRLDQAKLSNVNLNECLESTLVIAKNPLKYKVTVKKEYGDIPRISCSPSQINQVFLNLLVNAAQAIENKGTILIKTYYDHDYVYVVIQDNGKGIAKEHLQKIFDPFFTTKPIGEGTGLGLSISFQIIEKHGGKIRVASEVGKGTRFTISLPIETD